MNFSSAALILTLLPSVTRGGKTDISNNVWNKTPTIGDRSLLPESDWLMTYGKGTFAQYAQDSSLWEEGSIYTKQSGTSNDPTFYIRRYCGDCASTHIDIIYKRMTPVEPDMDIEDLFLNNWFKLNNNLGVDFNLFNNFEDALNDTNKWQYCNYNDRGIGFPRDCGPSSGIGGNWNSLSRGGKRNIAYYVWNGNPTATIDGNPEECKQANKVVMFGQTSLNGLCW